MQSASRSTRKIVISAALLAALASIAIYVVLVLPERVQQVGKPLPPTGRADVASPPPQRPAIDAAPAPAQAENDRLVAEASQASALQKLAKLEGEGARVWGAEMLSGTGMALVEEALAKANGAIVRRAFGDASSAFAEVGAQLDRLADSKPERLARAMAEGAAALAGLDAPSALKQFTIAAAAAPGNAEAERGLDRARKLPEALASVAAGDAAVAARDFPTAKSAYQRAGEIDPGLAVAREKLRDIDARISAQAYQSAVTEAVARLREGNAKSAETALARAQRLRPNAPELADLRMQIAAASKLSEIRRLQGAAEAMERQEKWSEAAKAYEQVLALDASAAFAGRGLEQAKHLAALHGLIDGYLASPERLRSSEPRSHAQAVLGQASASEPGPVLRGKADRLTELLAAAQAPIPVTLKSDNATQIEILRVGPLGIFERHSLSLIPGRYTAVGRRAGYRDVRVQFEVARAEQPLEIVVQCIERIR